MIALVLRLWCRSHLPQLRLKGVLVLVAFQFAREIAEFVGL